MLRKGIESKSRLKARSRKLVVSKNCKKMQMTRVKGVKSKRVNRAHARTGTRSCTGSKRVLRNTPASVMDEGGGISVRPM